MPHDRDGLFDAAVRANIAGRLDEAASLCKKLLLVAPSDVEARTLHAIIASRKGRHDEAISQFEEILRAEPNQPDALIWLSITLRQTGTFDQARDAALKASQLRPHDGIAFNNLGLCQMALQQLDEAARSFRKAAQAMPGSSEVAVNLGTVLQLQGLSEQADIAFRKALEVVQRSPGAYAALGRALLDQNQYEIALECAKRAMALEPSAAPARILMAKLLTRAGQLKEAEQHAQRAVEIDPKSAVAHSILGTALKSQGLVAEADRHFRTSIALQPKQGSAYLSLVLDGSISRSDQDVVDAMLDLISEHGLPETEIKALHYGLGRVLEDSGEFAEAMRHYDEANRLAYDLQFRGRSFDRDRHSETVLWPTTVFTGDLLSTFEGAGSDSDLPIFIVGMMRSGTTLLEQILSRHPEVRAAGEQDFWIDHGFEAFDRETRALSPERLNRLAEKYLALLRGLAPSCSRVTDKMPANTASLGLIHLALPNARIIHMTRNPADTCFSIYATPNENPFDYGHSKENIAFAFETHALLMKHWRSVLPPDRFLEVAYEELVSSPEPVTRRVVEFCGLEWSERCLAPEKSERAVSTPSMWQVRQPIYKTSVHRWENFEAWIPEFKALL